MSEKVIGVFEGGGIKGIALAGAAAGALSLGYQFERTVGTSAGAIVSAMVAAGYNGDELRKATLGVRWPSILQNDLLSRIPFIGKHLAMALRLGIHPARRLESTLSALLAAKGVRIFGDLDPGCLQVVATDLNHGRGIVFPDGLTALGHDADSFPVARAVTMSAAVPFIFRPVPIDDRTTGETLLMADGAMTARFPVQLVPRDPSVIGFRLHRTETAHKHREIDGPLSLASAVISAGITAREDLPVLCGRLDRLVSVSVDQDSLDFGVGSGRAGQIFDIGFNAAVETLGPVPAQRHMGEPA